MKPPKEYAKELSIEMCSVTDVVKPNFASNKKALIAVDKVIETTIFFRDSINYYSILQYFEQVKTEIINLK